MGKVFSRAFGKKSVQQAEKHEEPPEKHCYTPACSLSAKSCPTSSAQSRSPAPQTPIATNQSVRHQSPSSEPKKYTVPTQERSPLVRKVLVQPPALAQKRKRAAAISIKTNESNKRFRLSGSPEPAYRHPSWKLTKEGVCIRVLHSFRGIDAS